MAETHTLMFDPFRLDLRDERLWRGEVALRLTNKAFAVLRYLVEHPEQLATKDVLFEGVWPDTYVGDATLAMCIRELRQALGDSAREPQFIETVRGRGYRFLVPVTATDRFSATSVAMSPSGLPPQSAGPSSTPSLSSPPPSGCSPVRLVGREAELTQLHQWLDNALQGERQIGFITGEAGIGKTTLVDAFAAHAGADGNLWIGHGQCIEQYGAGEAYLPVLEALGRLGRAPGSDYLIETLRQQAPSWLLQMPALLPAAEFDALQQRGSGATRERMLRELAEAVDTLTAEHPLVLVLEDLHWSDMSTLEWLAYVARRRDPARLLVLGTYRPVEAIVQAHPLRTVTQELQRHGQCEELVLEYLPEAGVAAYLGRRFGEQALPERLAQVVHQRTNGNPLFMVTVVDEMVRRHVLMEGSEGWVLRGEFETVAAGVPESVRQLIEQQIEQLGPEEQALLEAASVAGTEFSAAAVAAGINDTVEAVEARCAALARRGQLVQTRGTTEWPDGTVAARYGFLHAMYQEVLYDRVPTGRQVRLHQQIGVRQEAGYGAQAWEMAAELAIHFVCGRDAPRAVQYLRYAGENALRRSAHQEAIAHLTRGLEVLTMLPDTIERCQHELTLCIALSTALTVTMGQAAPEVEETYVRARELCSQIGDTPQVFPVLHGLWLCYIARVAFQTAQEVAEQLFSLSQRHPSPVLLAAAHRALGTTSFYRGKLVSAGEQLQRGIALYDSSQRRPQVLRDPWVPFLSFAAFVLWFPGLPDQALQKGHEALTLARELSHPYSLAIALLRLTWIHQFRREWQAAREQAEILMELGSAQGFALLSALGTALRGSTLAALGQAKEGMRQIRQGMAASRSTGVEVYRPYFLALMAETYGRARRTGEGLRLLIEAQTIVNNSEECWWQAELHRLKGELLLQQASPDMHQAETCFHQALAVARHQQAKSLELRAATSLARLWQSQDKRQDAYDLLALVYEWFTEGFDTADLIDAKTLLDDFGVEVIQKAF